jgi:putative peptidoglycan lipid II flippase
LIMPQKSSKLSHAVANLTIINFISLLAGFLSAVVIANFFGTTYIYDAFILAWMIPELLIFVVNNLALATVMPIFLEIENKKGTAAAWKESWRAISSVMLGGLMLVLLTIMLTPDVLGLLGTGSLDSSIISNLMPWLMVTFWFSLLHRLFSGLHYAHRSYFVTHASAVFLPLGTISAAILGAGVYGVQVLAWGMAVGAFLQMLMLVPGVVAWGGRYFSLRPGGVMLNRMGLMSLPLLLYAFADRASVVIDRSIASTLSAGAISALKYGQQLLLAMAALVSVPINRVILVENAKSAADNDVEGFQRIFSRGIAASGVLVMMVVAITVPLAHPLVNFLLERGAFDAESTVMVGDVFLLYVLSLPALSFVSLIQGVNISFKRPGTLSIAGGTAIAMTLIFDLIFVNIWGFRGIALACVFTQIGWALVFFLLSRNLVNKPIIAAFGSLYKAVGSGLVVGGLIWLLDSIWLIKGNYLLWLKLSTSLCGGFILYFVLLILFRENVTLEILGKLRRRLGHHPI